MPKDRIVVVEPRQMLRRISLRHLGRFSCRMVRQMQALNPGLDPSHIEIGLRLHDSTQPLPHEKKHERIVALRE